MWATVCDVVGDRGGLGEYSAKGGEVERVRRGAGNLVRFAEADFEALCIEYEGSGS